MCIGSRFLFLVGVPFLSSIALSPARAQSAVSTAKKQAAKQTAEKATGKASLPAVSARDLAASLTAIEKSLDEARTKLHIPGIALVIVKENKILYLKGLGLRDVAHKLPVTPETLFAIGSSTKAFTAMTVMMSADDDKLALSDPPRKHLAYFKLRDPEADRKITISDLLCHRSGLNRTDLSWALGALNSEELIRVAGEAKPTAKFGEKFQYQNTMFLTAGEIVAKVQGKPWRDVVAERIFKPLGMGATETSIQEMQAAPDHSLGYTYDEDAKQLTPLPMRDLRSIAPAGAINSNARDMAQWIRLMLGQGVWNGKRLVSSANFAALLQKHMNVAGNLDYGYGWFLRDWHGHKVVEHGGNIDGFNAEVAFMPDQKLGLVLLTNVTASPLGTLAMDAIWNNLVGLPQSVTKSAVAIGAKPSVDPALEAGTYHLDAPARDIVVTYKDGKLTGKPTGQAEAPLENVGGRRYKVGLPAPSGFFLTFRPSKADPSQTELEMETPGGDKIVLQTQKPDSAKGAVALPASMQELLGRYEIETPHFAMEIAVDHGKAALVVAGQPPYPLEAKGKDQYALGGVPDSFGVTVKRDTAGKISGIFLKQPQGNLDLKRDTAASPTITVETLMQKVIDASGGADNLKKHHSLQVTADIDFENQGLTGVSTSYARAPYLAADETTLLALGRKIATINNYYDGAQGGTVTSFSPPVVKSGTALEEARAASDFYQELNWKTLYPTVTVKRVEKVNGEEAYVVEKKPAQGSAVTDYISTKTFLLLKRETAFPSPTLGITTTTFSDYRPVDGVLIPFTRLQNVPEAGDTIIKVKEIHFDTAIPDTVFQPAKAPSPARK